MNRIEWQSTVAGFRKRVRAMAIILVGFGRKKKLAALWILSGLMAGYIGLQITGRAISRGSMNEFLRGLQDGSGDRLLEKQSRELEKRIKREMPKGVFLVIDTARNTLSLRKKDEIIHQAKVSCGSGNMLDEPGGRRRWIFDTPRGEFTVQYKMKDPVWIKPDWAFIEEGDAIPKSRQERVETGVLGDYALGFGNGFFIHGTLYTRLLGRSVTHGCVRVGDEDLAKLYRRVPLGSKIFIY